MKRNSAVTLPVVAFAAAAMLAGFGTGSARADDDFARPRVLVPMPKPDADADHHRRAADCRGDEHEGRADCARERGLSGSTVPPRIDRDRMHDDDTDMRLPQDRDDSEHH